MKVKELKALLGLFNEDMEVSIEGAMASYGFDIQEVELAQEKHWDKELNKNVLTPVVHLISHEVQSRDEDCIGEDL